MDALLEVTGGLSKDQLDIIEDTIMSILNTDNDQKTKQVSVTAYAKILTKMHVSPITICDNTFTCEK